VARHAAFVQDGADVAVKIDRLAAGAAGTDPGRRQEQREEAYRRGSSLSHRVREQDLKESFQGDSSTPFKVWNRSCKLGVVFSQPNYNSHAQ
jgi:hypothetical protein